MWSKANIIAGVLIIGLLMFWYFSYNNLKKEVMTLRNDNKIYKEQIINKDKAALYRQEEYQLLEDKYKQLNQQMEELNDKDSTDWLNAGIPGTVDNTIPY